MDLNGAIPAHMQAVLRCFSETPVILSHFVDSIPKEALLRKRGEGVWTIADHVTHLADVQPMGAGRIRRILQEDTPEFVPYFPSENVAQVEAAPPPPPMNEVLNRFRSGREAILDLLRQTSPADWERRAIYPEYEQYGLAIFVRHFLMHDHWHMYRMEELWLTRDKYLTTLTG